MGLFDNKKASKTSNSRTKKVVVSVSSGRDQHSSPRGGNRDTRDIIQDARDEAFRIKKSAEDESRKIRQDSIEIEKRLAQKDESLDSKLNQIATLEKKLDTSRDSIQNKEKEINAIRTELVEKLSKVSSYTKEEAKKMILNNLDEELKGDIAKKIKEAEEKIKAESSDKAKEIIVNAMIAGATDWTAEYTVSTVKLESDDIKGRIIGKEGRNIRAFELSTGVDVELESDVAGEVRLSSFDPVRREVARMALEWLVKDARIQPSRIEQLVEKAQKEVEQDMSEAGRKAANELGLYNLSQLALDTLGRLKFRYSYGQNQLIASIETGRIAKKIASEIGANQTTAVTGGLFHDIGKTEMDKEGTHVQLGVELAKKFNFPQEVTDCIAQHHEDEPFSSIESIVVHIADAVSGARPGARHEAVEDYIKRLTEIENVATTFSGVEKAYAIQAGREVRVIVQPDTVDDEATIKLSHDIKQKLEDELTYPGQITVTVIRELRAVDIAK